MFFSRHAPLSGHCAQDKATVQKHFPQCRTLLDMYHLKSRFDKCINFVGQNRPPALIVHNALCNVFMSSRDHAGRLQPVRPTSRVRACVVVVIVSPALTLSAELFCCAVLCFWCGSPAALIAVRGLLVSVCGCGGPYGGGIGVGGHCVPGLSDDRAAKSSKPSQKSLRRTRTSFRTCSSKKKTTS
jgi:hypothetical protein